MKAKDLKKLVNSLPSFVRITNKINYEIVFIDDFIDPKVLGECRPNTKQIVLKKGLSNTLLLRTLLHESLHAIAMENDFELPESQVLNLEDGIFRFLKLNNLMRTS